MKKTGGVAPSSVFLSKKMARLVPKESLLVIEFGGGTGALTRALLDHLKEKAELIVFESNPVFIEKLKKIQDVRLTIVEGDATQAKKVLTIEKHGTIDAIVSSIPIANLKKEEAFSLLTNWNDLLKPNGICIQYQYSLLTQKLFKQVFSNTKIYFEPRNIPPAFLYRGMKKAPL